MLLTNQLEKLKNDKYQLTPQRRAVLKALNDTMAEHPTAEEIHAQARKYYSSIGLATVYRTLELLTELKILSPILVPKGSTRYEAAHGQHGHFICLSCGRIFDVDEELNRYTNAVEKEGEFTVTSTSVQLFGYCRDCKLKEEKPSLKNSRQKKE
ncbi:MAG: transcriptional repressor [bacterium]|jgi:Fur family ferric uptake transcriptional regulator